LERVGTVPRKKAIFSNRMSPAGIPMFYGAEDEATAIAETYTPSPGTPAVVTVGKFRTARPAWVVDLTALPPFPSLFDQERRHLRGPLRFLRAFVKDLSKPIKKDGREHIGYVPTQIVTDYLRHVFRTETGHRARGVIFPSTRKKGGK
jgi:RES domain-containing protein